jgi:hypothetical protein
LDISRAHLGGIVAIGVRGLTLNCRLDDIGGRRVAERAQLALENFVPTDHAINKDVRLDDTAVHIASLAMIRAPTEGTGELYVHSTNNILTGAINVAGMQLTGQATSGARGLFADNGALRYRGAGGTLTTLGNS